MEHGQEIEDTYREQLPQIPLAKAISRASHVEMDTWPKRIWYLLIGTLVVFAVLAGPLWLLRGDLINPRILIVCAAVALSIIAAVSRAVAMSDWNPGASSDRFLLRQHCNHASYTGLGRQQCCQVRRPYTAVATVRLRALYR